jgi:hypothetical protein
MKQIKYEKGDIVSFFVTVNDGNEKRSRTENGKFISETENELKLLTRWGKLDISKKDIL